MEDNLRANISPPALDKRGNQCPVSGALSARRVWTWGLAGALLTFAAFPPLGWSLLGWVGPACWIHLARDPAACHRRTLGRIYGAGFVFWLITLHWVRLPHPAAYLGWFVLSAYLASYVVWFVGAVSWFHHRYRWPLWMIAPIVWVGLEWVRGVLFSGFSLALLSHTQVTHLPLVQLASWGGAYLLSGLMVLMAAGLEHLFFWGRNWFSASRSMRVADAPMTASTSVVVPRNAVHGLLPLSFATVLLLGAWATGTQRLRMGLPESQAASQAASAVSLSTTSTTEPTLATQPNLSTTTTVALIQGSIDTEFDGDPDTGKRALSEYVELTRSAVAARPSVKLVIWPESMFAADFPLVYIRPPAQRPPDYPYSEEDYHREMTALAEWRDRKSRGLGAVTGATSLVGGQVWEASVDGRQLYNSALLIDRQGEVVGRYDKCHTVMFGEYIPFGDWFPWIYRLTPIPSGLSRGREPQLFTVGNLKISPSICFENTVPHLIRRQVNELSRKGRAPNCLVTITNDGWFWGSSLLDLHLACGIFRAVELDLPLLIAANTGFSAYISPRGEIMAQGPRRASQVVAVDVKPGAGSTWYRVWGDVPYVLSGLLASWPLMRGAAQRTVFQRRSI